MLSHRDLYCPSHFGNTYECVLEDEMQSLLEEARFWGFNRFSDWFDTIDLYDVYTRGHRLFNLPEALWQRKFNNFQIADRLGFDIGLLITPNHVFANQVTSENAAVKDGHIFGQLVCPSKPGVVETILTNYRNIFQDFVTRGLRLRFIGTCPYDYGGCACEKCNPWIKTFGELFSRIGELATEMFGPLDLELMGWWWKDEDHEVFSKWADAHKPGYFKSFAYHLPYGQHEYKLRPIPRDCAEKAFFHIAYGEARSVDAYCHYGANIAPKRIERTVRFLTERGAKGYSAYSEGDHDDINKALLGGLSSGQFSTADEVIAAYARRYFGSGADGWVELFNTIGDYPEIAPSKALALLAKLKPDTRPSWRLEQVEKRLLLAQADQRAAEALRGSQDADFLDAAKSFLRVKESLYRQTWRLGLQRHAFRFDCPSYMPTWYDEYIKRIGTARQTLRQDLADQT